MQDPAVIVLITFAFGALVGLAGYWVIDYSERRGRAALELTTESIPSGVVEVVLALESGGIILDHSNTVLRASPGAQLLGLVADGKIVHSSILEVIDDSREKSAPVSRTVELTQGRFSDDQQIILHVRAAPLGAKYMLLLTDDHTEEERLNSVRRDFIANVSHELKTPVGAIALLSDAIDAAGDDLERVRSFTGRLRREAQRLGTMTKEIIDLTYIQTVNPLESAVPVKVADIVDAAFDANRVAAEAKRIRLTARVVEDVSVMGDQQMLTTALKNLVANAVTYSDDHEHVGVGVRRTEDGVEIAVTDKGIGIDASEQQRVFERFYRVDPARSRHTGGTGLGLSIVKHVTRSHGGSVSVWSKPGEGSTFTIRLPYVDPSQEDKE
ncbi:MAG TPA: two-component sensor histidine kinase [Candidatus Agrococcus pullicola]|uniref:Sensor-like histidine kinase SenX3 n=1 Tax=Candidatus Agrococcus pullicola TaxID=2838429 RepID=A0A9D1YYG8_9MICO|nr:two-component sensor histidine kinase [Candidatus Agrococcus pullicola]